MLAEPDPEPEQVAEVQERVITYDRPEDFGPVLPGTAETILALDPDISQTIRATAYGLINTVHNRTEALSEQVRQAALRVVQLERQLGQRNEDNRQLRARLGLLSVPDGFERNQGRVAARVPTSGGQMVVPEWIRPVGDGTVELLAGRQPGEPTYVIELFLRPNYTETPTETAAPWFLALLCSRDGSFHQLAEEVRRLDNPAATAKVYRYHALEEERTELTAELNRVSDALNATRDRMDACRHRMEAGQLPYLMRHLEDRNTFHPRLPQLGRRRGGNPRRRQVDGGASP
jgi:hypothetical protein